MIDWLQAPEQKEVPMPNVPDDGSWTTYIIGSLLAALGVIWGLLLAITKYVEWLYRNRIAELNQVIVNLEKRVCTLEEEVSKCHDEKIQLALKLIEISPKK